MERHRQTFDEIVSKLSAIQSEWKDDLAKTVMDRLRAEHGLELKP